MSMRVDGGRQPQLHQREQALAARDDLGVAVRREHPQRLVDAASPGCTRRPPGSCLASLRGAVGRRLDHAPGASSMV